MERMHLKKNVYPQFTQETPTLIMLTFACFIQLLQTVNLAYLYPDSKTFVDKPTVNPTNATITQFYSIAYGSFAPPTVGEISTFVQEYFVS